MDLKLFDRAVSAAGGVTKFAAVLGESPQNVSNWRRRAIPASKCMAFSAATGVSVRKLRPNDWAKFWPDADAKKAG